MRIRPGFGFDALRCGRAEPTHQSCIMDKPPKRRNRKKKQKPQETEKTREYSDEQLYANHEESLRKQDESMDHMLVGIGRIKQVG